MVTKGIITAIPIGEEENKYLVRLPFFEDATQDSADMVYECTLSEPSGVIQGYSIGDIVYCAFEDNDLGRPVIIGKLFANDLENVGGEINTLELDVGNRANLPTNTTIGNITPEEVANIPNIKNKLDKMGGTIFGALELDNTIQYKIGKSVNIVDTDGSILQSELTDHIFSDSMTRQCSVGTEGTTTDNYFKLCNISIKKHYQARFIAFRIYVGKGNNGNPNQNACIDFLLQSGWASDPSTAGRFGGYWELHKMGTAFTTSNFELIVISNSMLNYDVWLKVTGATYCKPSYTVWYDREVLNDKSYTCTITHIGNVKETTEPSGTKCDISSGSSSNVEHATSADKIKQTVTSSNHNYPILLAPNGQTTTTDDADTYFSTTLQYNPSDAKLELQSPNGYITSNDTTSGVKVSIAVGTGHSNHGIYSNGYSTSGTALIADGKWMVYRKSDGSIVLNGNAATATRANNSTYADWTQNTDTSAGTYYIPFGAGYSTNASNRGLQSHNGLSLYTRVGTTAAVGYSYLKLGNSTSDGVDGNMRGELDLYPQSGSGYAGLRSPSTMSGTKIMYLPNEAGTLISVVDSGTDGDWTYYKYSDGRAECWGIFSYTDVAFTSWSSPLYQSTSDQPAAESYPSGLFLSDPNVSAAVECTTSGSTSIYFIGSRVAGDKDKTFQPRILGVSSTTRDFNIHYHAVGKWK